MAPPPGPPPPGPPPPGGPPGGPPPSGPDGSQPPPPGPTSSCFNGFLLSTLAFGALIMLYVQLVQVLLLYPSRDKTFWSIVIYSSALVPFTITSFVAQASFSGFLFAGGDNGDWCNALGQISAVIIPCLADLILFHRLKVLWNRQNRLMILMVVGFLYLLRLGVSIAVVISSMKPPDAWSDKTKTIVQVALSTLTVALNGTFSGLICYRLFSMRNNAERVLGRLQATLYNSYTTIFVESGGLFTIWATIDLFVVAKNNETRGVFDGPLKYINILTRMLMVLRIAQNRAWTAEIINASVDGMLDWDVSSAPSIELPQRTEREVINKP